MITLTDTASVKVKELISQEGQDGLMLRVAVRPGGCSGYSYDMYFDSEKDADDVVALVAYVVVGALVSWVVDVAARRSREASRASSIFDSPAASSPLKMQANSPPCGVITTGLSRPIPTSR